jgi:hypothetical protein
VQSSPDWIGRRGLDLNHRPLPRKEAALYR